VPWLSRALIAASADSPVLHQVYKDLIRYLTDMEYRRYINGLTTATNLEQMDNHNSQLAVGCSVATLCNITSLCKDTILLPPVYMMTPFLPETEYFRQVRPYYGWWSEVTRLYEKATGQMTEGDFFWGESYKWKRVYN
jgi:hypothetical protein